MSSSNCAPNTEVRAAYQRLTERFGDKLHAVLVQPMIGDGTEVIVGVADDHLFGPLLVFGLGRVATEVLADHARIRVARTRRKTPSSGG